MMLFRFLALLIPPVSFIFIMLVILVAVGMILPVINEVNNEWWPDSPHAHLAMVVFLQMWIFLYFISRMILFILFKKTFRDKSKSSFFALAYLITASVVWFIAGLPAFR